MRSADLNHDDQRRFESLVLAYDKSLPGGIADSPETVSAVSEPMMAKLRAAQATLRMLEHARREGFSGDSLSDSGPPEDAYGQDDPLDRPSVTGQRIGRFEIVRELGRGGFGVVFLAIDPGVGRQVALKVPRPEVLVSSSTRARFLREAKAAGALAHPNLVAVYEVGEDGPLCYIASTYCAGPNLAQWLATSGHSPDQREAATLVEVLARAVEHAHSRGVLHRDIKPSNILLEPAAESAKLAAPSRCLADMTPRLTDFGLAKLVELADDETRSGALLGTPVYMAPEQAEGRACDAGPATDVFALGVILYEILAGGPPFRGESDVQTLQLVSQCEVPRLARWRSGIARDLEAIALKCLELAPARRYHSAG